MFAIVDITSSIIIFLKNLVSAKFFITDIFVCISTNYQVKNNVLILGLKDKNNIYYKSDIFFFFLNEYLSYRLANYS